MSRLVNRNVLASTGRRTSIRLEPEFWDALRQMATQTNRTIDQIVQSLPHNNKERTSAVRVAIITYFRETSHV